MTVTTALYLVDVISSIDNLIGTIWFLYITVLFLLSFFFLIFSLGDENITAAILKKLIIKIFNKWWIVALSVLLSVIVPSKNTMYLMLGSSLLAQSNSPAKVTEAIELKLDSVIKELKSHETKQ